MLHHRIHIHMWVLLGYKSHTYIHPSKTKKPGRSRFHCISSFKFSWGIHSIHWLELCNTPQRVELWSPVYHRGSTSCKWKHAVCGSWQASSPPERRDQVHPFPRTSISPECLAHGWCSVHICREWFTVNVQKSTFFWVWSLIYKLKTRVFHMSVWMSPELFFRSQGVRRTIVKVRERLRYCPAAGIQIMGLGSCQKSRSSALDSCFSISCLLPASPANEVGSSTAL